MKRIPDQDPWRWIAAADDQDIPLAEAALWIARDEYPELDINDRLHQLQTMIDELSRDLGASATVSDRLQRLNSYLYEQQGFSGNVLDFEDPRNSYLNDVLDRRVGIPISLSVLYLELARALGLDCEGVSFPGHFLLRVPMLDGIVVLDAFNRGRSIDVEELKSRAEDALGGVELSPAQVIDLLKGANSRTILARMLRNLKAVYVQAEQWDRAVRTADRLVTLQPEQAVERRDRGLFYSRLGHHARARDDLSHYLRLVPLAEDAEAVDRMIRESALGARQKLH